MKITEHLGVRSSHKHSQSNIAALPVEEFGPHGMPGDNCLLSMHKTNTITQEYSWVAKDNRFEQHSKVYYNIKGALQDAQRLQR